MQSRLLWQGAEPKPCSALTHVNAGFHRVQRRTPNNLLDVNLVTVSFVAAGRLVGAQRASDRRAIMFHPYRKEVN